MEPKQKKSHFSFFRKQAEPELSRVEPGFEEGEHRTPWTGVVLLLIMFVAGLVFGWRAVDDLARVPSRPSDLSTCANAYAPTNYYGPLVSPSPISSPYPPGAPTPFKTAPGSPEQQPTCTYSDLEQREDIPTLIAKRDNIVAALDEQSQGVRQDYDRAVQKAQSLEQQYNLRLQEMQSGVSTITPQVLSDLQKQVNDAGQEENRLSSQLDQQIATDRANSAELTTVDNLLRTAYAKVFTEQEHRQRIYEFKVFLLQLLFVLPLFAIVLWLYIKQIRKNSPYAIILTAIVAVTGVLVLRVFFGWFWDLFLAQLINELWQWIQNFELLRSLVFYLGMVLSFLVFGGAVYYLQKRIFDPRRVAIRRFRQKQCPKCQTSIDLAELFCPNCGQAVRKTCSHCGHARFVGLPFCPSCGTLES